jgi:hypothetical protein
VKHVSRLLALAALGAMGGVAVFTGPSGAVAAEDSQPSIEETYDYPGAAAIQGIKLLKGDGHILLVDCASAGSHMVAETLDAAGVRKDFCFQLKGSKGDLTMELAGVYLIWADNSHDVVASLSVDGQSETKTVKKNDSAGVGIGNSESPATLLELRV